jgi:hypothetical protein
MTYWITSTSAARGRLWQRLTGQDCLPVTTQRPIEFRFGDERMTAYILDAAKLHPMAVRRVAGYVAKRNGIGYDTAVGMLADGWLIPAEDCELVGAQQEGQPGWHGRSPAFLWKLTRFPYLGGWPSMANVGDPRRPSSPYSTKSYKEQ